VETGAYRPNRNIFGRLCTWPKTCSDFCRYGSPFSGHFRMSPTVAAVDPFRPCRDYDTSAPRQRLAVVPGHPLRGIGRQFPGRAL